MVVETREERQTDSQTEILQATKYHAVNDGLLSAPTIEMAEE
jgi:hypothetical protein